MTTQVTPTPMNACVAPDAKGFTKTVRAGSLKRVASAVGEGSIAIAAVHQVWHE